MVDVVRDVYVDLVGDDAGIFGRVYAREVLVLEEDRAVCWGKRGEGERAL